jgi:peptide chain release factor subunit 1
MIGKFFEEISLDTGMICFGVNDTMKAMEMSALDKILLFEEIEINRYEVKYPDGSNRVIYLTPRQEDDPKWFKEPTTGVDLDILTKEALSDWLLVNY